MALYRKKSLVVEAEQISYTCRFKINGIEFCAKPGNWLIKEPTDTVYVVDAHRFQKDFEQVTEPNGS